MNKELGNIKIYVEDNYELMSAKAAQVLQGQISEKKNSVIGFATGSTPIGLYKELVSLYKAGSIDFSEITAFNLDEYYPIQKSSPQSYDYFMKDNLFNHVNVNLNKLNIPNGEATDTTAECANYEQKIAKAGGIDLQILGIGLNGHIGFNEPDDFFTQNTHCVALDKSTIDANLRFFDSYDDIPKKALTMGIKSIMSAKKILLLVNSEKKAAIIKETIYGNITPKVPATILQLHPDVTIVADKEAGKFI